MQYDTELAGLDILHERVIPNTDRLMLSAEPPEGYDTHHFSPFLLLYPRRHAEENASPGVLMLRTRNLHG